MSKFISKAIVASVVMVAGTGAIAAFNKDMTGDKVLSEMVALKGKGESLQSIASSACAAGILVETVTSQLLAVPGVDSSTAITAVIKGCGSSAAARTYSAAVGANVPSQTVLAAFVSADPELANFAPATAAGPAGGQQGGTNTAPGLNGGNGTSFTGTSPSTFGGGGGSGASRS